MQKIEGLTKGIQRGKNPFPFSVVIFILLFLLISSNHSCTRYRYYMADTQGNSILINAKCYNTLNRANELLKQGSYEQAFMNFNLCIKECPSNAFFYLGRGQTHEFKGQYDMAIADYTQAIEIDPGFADAYYQRGIAYFKKGQYDLSKEDCYKAININPKHVEAYYICACAHYYKGQHDMAIADYTRVIEMNPKHAKAFFGRGITYCMQGKSDLAISDLNQALKLDPNFTGKQYEDILSKCRTRQPERGPRLPPGVKW